MTKNNNQNVEVYDIFPTDEFNNNMRFYIKKRKFKNIHNHIKEVLNEIRNGNFEGNKIKDMDVQDDIYVYKARARNSNTNVGKSNGYRLIYYVKTENKLIILLTIYYKKDDVRVPTKKELKELINEYLHI